MLESDGTNYLVNSGTVDGSGNQEALLTIKQVKMESFKSTFTYKCSVKSSQYPNSPESDQIDAVAVIPICKFNFELQHRTFRFVRK